MSTAEASLTSTISFELDDDHAVPLPRVAGIPVLGALPELLIRHYDALERWFEVGGDMFDLSLAGIEFKVVARGSLASEAINGHRANFVRSPIHNNGVRLLTGEAMIGLEGEAWRARRQAFQPHFRAKIMRQMVSRISATIDEVLDEVPAGRTELASLCDRITMSVALRVLFGASMSEEVFDELSELAPSLIGQVGVQWVTSALPRWIPRPGQAKFERALARIHELIAGMVVERRRDGAHGDDLLATLLHMADGGDLSEDQLRDEAVTVLLAGYETTSNTLSWLLHTLAHEPSWVARVQAEADAVLGPDGSGDVRELELALRCFQEGLRLHPAALWVMRLAVADTPIGDHLIQAGDTLLCSTHLIHRNPKDWREPARFDPDRFCERPPDHAFVPFGIGSMSCIGKHLALIEGQLAVAKLLARWDLVPVADHTPRKRISATLTNADGIYVELRERRASS